MERARLRTHFLECVVQYAPEAKEALGGRPLQARRESASDFELVLEEWAQTWNLSAPWVLERARIWLASWDHFEEVAARQQRPVVPHEAVLCPDSRNWPVRIDPTTLPREAAHAWIDAIYDRCEEESGLAPPQRKRDAPDHLRWCVLYQVKGMTFEELANRSHRSVSTVQEAVRPILEQLPLPQRKRSRKSSR